MKVIDPLPARALVVGLGPLGLASALARKAGAAPASRQPGEEDGSRSSAWGRRTSS
jgi:hypothetical protein